MTEDNNTTTTSITVYLSLTSSPSTPRSAISISRKSTTSCELREQASTVTNVPLSAIKLIFRGRMIVDKKGDNVVEEYKLEEGSVVHVMGKPIVVANNVGGSSATSSPSTEAGASVSLPTANLNSLDIASGSSTTSPLAAALTKLRTSNDGPTYRTAVVTADKLLGNIVSHPMEEKYRTIKKSNPAFSKRLGSVTGGHDLLLASGFTIETKEGIEYYTLTPSADAWPTLVAARKEVGRILAENNRNSSGSSVGLGAGATLPSGAAPTPSNLFPGGMPGGTGGAPDMAMLSDPNMMQNVMGMINNPMVQNMMQNDPRFANNPMLQQSLRALQANPEMMQQMTQMMADPNVRNRLANVMQQGGGTDPFANGPEAMRRQMEQFQQMSNQFSGSSGGSNAGSSTATGAVTINGSGGGGSANNNANASSSSNGNSSSGNDNEMTEEEMIAEAIARSLRES